VEGQVEPEWQSRVLDRSLQRARARALQRGRRFLKAASELIEETGRTDFTVQQVVLRSRMSLRSFYQHFEGKDALLLALLEEAVASFISSLEAEVLCHDDPVDQLRAFVYGLYAATNENTGSLSRALVIQHLHLAASQPAEVARVLRAQSELLRSIIGRGMDAGVFRSDLPVGELSAMLSQTLISALHMNVLGTHVTGEAIGVKALWAFCLGGVSPPA